MMNFFGKRKFIVLSIIAVLIVGGGYVYFKRDKPLAYDFVVAQRGDIVQEVSVTGRVKASEDVNLAFERSGKVDFVYKDVGDRVERGQVIATLQNSDLAAQLSQAKADFAIIKAQSQNIETNLDVVKQKQDVLVANAYKNLLSSGLVAVPSDRGVDGSYNPTPPVITGSYNGKEGVYNFVIYRKSAGLEDYVIHTFDLETTGPVDVRKTGPTPLGTKGLFIDFPDGPNEYNNKNWYVAIPNKESSVYASNLNSYNQAIAEREQALENAKAEIEGRAGSLSVFDARLLRAEAEIRNIEAQIAKTIIRSPISGVVVEQNAKVGQIVSANVNMVSVISEGDFQIEVNVPEADIAKISIGNRAVVTLDAYGRDVIFEAIVAVIDPAETILDGVATYKTTLQFVENNARIKSGMTANIDIESNSRKDVVYIPARSIIRKNGEQFVRLLKGEDIIEVKVETGLRASDGNVEIISGINEGDRVITFIRE